MVEAVHMKGRLGKVTYTSSRNGGADVAVPKLRGLRRTCGARDRQTDHLRPLHGGGVEVSALLAHKVVPGLVDPSREIS